MIKAGGFVFLAGQVPTDNNAKPIEGTVAEKTHKMCQNTSAVLEAAGSSLEKVVKVTVRRTLRHPFERHEDTAVFSLLITIGNAIKTRAEVSS